MSVPVTCFIIMPFRPELAVVRDVVAAVVRSQSDGTAFRADDTFHPGIVIEHVKQSIATADFCVADVSGANPNVLWEAGYAHALDKPIIQIGQDMDLPFDIRALRTLRYSLAELNAMKPSKKTPFHTALGKAVRVVVDALRGKPRVLGAPYDELHRLAYALMRQSIYPKIKKPLLPIVLKALNDERKHNPDHVWNTGDAERLMKAIARVAAKDAQNTFWWLIVHGVLVYNQIIRFQYYGNGWLENLDLVALSERGVALLNYIQDPMDGDGA